MRILTAIAGAALLSASIGAWQSAPAGVRLAELAWPEAEHVLTNETVVVIPLGAAAAEHGPHLRLDTDLTIATYLARRASEAASVIVAPPLTYHYYPALLEYPGSTSLNLDTARTLTIDVVRSLARYGPRRFYVLNMALSAGRPLGAAAEALSKDGILLASTDPASRLDEASARVRQQDGGTHADEVETSMMLYIDPDGVDMTRAVRDFTPSAEPLRLTRTRGSSGTYSASGVAGDPTLATRDKGQAITERLLAGILGEIETVRRAPLPAATASPIAAAPNAAAAPRPLALRRPSGCSQGDERSIYVLGMVYARHWANGDAPSLAEMWSRDGDMVHPDGLVERGQETIRTNRTAMFLRHEYRGSQHPLTVGNVRCLTSDLAVVDAKWELRGVSDAAGKPLPSYHGLATLVVRRAGDDGWAIEAYRYTLDPTAVPLPTWLRRPGWPGRSPSERPEH